MLEVYVHLWTPPRRDRRQPGHRNAAAVHLYDILHLPQQPDLNMQGDRAVSARASCGSGDYHLFPVADHVFGRITALNNTTEVHTLLDLTDTNGVASPSRNVTLYETFQDVCAQTVYLINSKEEGI